jgi:putative transposase
MGRPRPPRSAASLVCVVRIEQLCIAPHVVAGRLNRIMAKRKGHNPDQIVRQLVTADRLSAEGKDTVAVRRELGVSEATDHRWRNQFGGLKAANAKRLKELERENATLKRLLADAELEPHPDG